MTPTKEKVIHRKITGEVVSAKTDKTRIVLVTRTMAHAKYGKRFRVSNRFACHDENNTYKLGDKVIIQECRPYSKTKRWRIIGKVSN